MTYSDAVKNLYYSLYGDYSTDFQSMLYRLIAKADPSNLELLRLAFGMQVLVWQEWQAAPNEREFFARYSLGIPSIKNNPGRKSL